MSDDRFIDLDEGDPDDRQIIVIFSFWVAGNTVLLLLVFLWRTRWRLQMNSQNRFGKLTTADNILKGMTASAATPKWLQTKIDDTIKHSTEVALKSRMHRYDAWIAADPSRSKSAWTSPYKKTSPESSSYSTGRIRHRGRTPKDADVKKSSLETSAMNETFYDSVNDIPRSAANDGLDTTQYSSAAGTNRQWSGLSDDVSVSDGDGDASSPGRLELKPLLSSTRVDDVNGYDSDDESDGGGDGIDNDPKMLRLQAPIRERRHKVQTKLTIDVPTEESHL